MDNQTGLELLEQFQRLGEVLYGCGLTELPEERQALVAELFPDVDNAPETLRQWARSLVQFAFLKGCNPDPFATVAANPWKFTDPEVLRAIEKLRARLPVRELEDGDCEDEQQDQVGPIRCIIRDDKAFFDDGMPDEATYAPADLASSLGISPRTLLDYAKRAGVATPAAAGGQNHRYSADDRVRIAQQAEVSNRPEIRAAARAVLQEARERGGNLAANPTKGSK